MQEGRSALLAPREMLETLQRERKGGGKGAGKSGVNTIVRGEGGKGCR